MNDKEYVKRVYGVESDKPDLATRVRLLEERVDAMTLLLEKIEEGNEEGSLEEWYEWY